MFERFQSKSWRGAIRAGWLALWMLGPLAAPAQDSVSTLNPGDGAPGYQDGPLTAARFNDPAGLAYDAAGNLYVADSRNHVIRKVTSEGVVSLLAGSAGVAGFANGLGAAARFDTPFGLVLMADGSLLVADTGNHLLRRVEMTGAVTSYGGLAGTPGNTNGPLAQARFHSPLGMKRDVAGNIWVADSGNHTIRRITPSGSVETMAGVPDTWGWQDGPAAVATFNGPVDVAVAADGRVLISDGFNHVIRCLGTNGVVTTMAGQGREAAWADGPGTAARFWNPAGLAFDSRENLYVADSRNHVLRMISPEGTVTTISGSGQTAGQTDGSNRSGRYFNPYGLAFDATGHLVVSDSYNQTLRRVFVPFTVKVSADDSGREIEWPAVIGRTYQVQYRNGWETGEWLNLGTSVVASDHLMKVTDHQAGEARRFYRVLVVGP